MFGLPLAFAFPAVLLALAGLPVLYYLLRVTPPNPNRVPFPPLRLILDLKPRDETAARTALVALAAAARCGGGDHSRDGRPRAQSVAGGRGRQDAVACRD